MSKFPVLRTYRRPSLHMWLGVKRKRQAHRSATSDNQISKPTFPGGRGSRARHNVSCAVALLQDILCLAPRPSCKTKSQKQQKTRNDAKNAENHEKQNKTAMGAPSSAREARRPSQNLPKTLPRPFPKPLQTPPKSGFYAKSLKIPKKSKENREKLPTKPPRPSPNPSQIHFKSIKKPHPKTH